MSRESSASQLKSKIRVWHNFSELVPLKRIQKRNELANPRLPHKLKGVQYTQKFLKGVKVENETHPYMIMNA